MLLPGCHQSLMITFQVVERTFVAVIATFLPVDRLGFAFGEAFLDIWYDLHVTIASEYASL